MACKTKKKGTQEKAVEKKGAAKKKPTTPRAAKESKVATKSKKSSASKTVAPMIVRMPHQPKHEEIEKQAFLLWERRGFIHGHDVEDWLIAEAQLKNGL